MPNVVIIEDDPTMSAQIVAAFHTVPEQWTTWTIQIAANGLRGLDIIRAHADDLALVVLDVLLPDLDGYECGVQIRNLHPVVPIIPFTAYPLELGFFRAIGCTAPIVKPVASSADLATQMMQRLTALHTAPPTAELVNAVLRVLQQKTAVREQALRQHATAPSHTVAILARDTQERSQIARRLRNAAVDVCIIEGAALTDFPFTALETIDLLIAPVRDQQQCLPLARSLLTPLLLVGPALPVFPQSADWEPVVALLPPQSTAAQVTATVQSLIHQHRQRQTLALATLTARERQVLALIAHDLPVAVVADILNIAKTTVCQYLVEIRAKLGVHTTEQARLIARRYGHDVFP